MKKKIIALAVVVAMLAIGTLSSTLAYFIDDEFNKNVMTVGNVDIVQDETFDDEVVIQPGENVQKEVEVTNIGQGDAYIRTLVAFEDTFDISANIKPYTYCGCSDNDAETNSGCKVFVYPAGDNDWLQIKVADEDGKYVDADGNKWTVYTVGYYNYDYAGLADSILPAGESIKSLASIELLSGTGNDFYARSGDKYDILVLTQAVQTGTFATADEAFAETYGVGAITADVDADVAAWFAEYLGVDVEAFDYSEYPADTEWPVWEDAAGEVTDPDLTND